MKTKPVIKSLFLDSLLWTEPAIFYGVCLFFKFIAFNIIWCLQTTFSAFSTAELYINGLLATLICLLPYGCFRKNGLQIVMMFLLDALLVVNLLYCRTYNTFIPLQSYGLASNPADFTSSVYDSFHWVDSLFPISTVLVLTVLHARKRELSSKTVHIKYFAPLTLLFVLFVGITLLKGGFKQAYASLQSANYYTCGTPMYTVFGSLIYDALQQQATYTPDIEQQINHWQNQHPAYKPLPDSISSRTNLVIIILNLMHLDDYKWKGMGQSILDPDKASFAVGSQMNIEWDVAGIPRQEIERQVRAYAISNRMIKYDVLKEYFQ